MIADTCRTQAVEIVVKVASGHVGDVVNAATVTAEDFPQGATDGDTNTPDLRSDLVVEKSHTGAVLAGEDITYTVTARNDGPSDSVGPIVVKDTIPDPDHFTFVSSTNDDWDCDDDGTLVTCTLATGLADGASSSFDLTFHVDPSGGPATLDNIVTINGPYSDPVPENNVASDPVATVVNDQVDLSIVKTASASSVVAGDTVDWEIAVTNVGPSTADSVSISDLVESGLTIVGLSGTGWHCDIELATCTLDVPLAPGTGVAEVVKVTTKVGSGVASGTVLGNGADVTTSSPESDPSNNHADDTVEVATNADLTLTKTAQGAAIAGKELTYLLTPHNEGPSDAHGPFTITDTLPDGMSYVSSSGAWVCDTDRGDDQVVVCTTPHEVTVVAGDDGPPLRLTVKIAPDRSGASLVNVARVDSDDDDDPDNNGAEATVVPGDEVDLSITKGHAGAVEIGTEMSFTIGVHNDGPSDARDVRVVDTLPTGLTYVSAAGDGWTCDDEGTCTLDGPLAPGEDSDPIAVTVIVTPQAYPGVTNRVVVSTSSDDIDDGNDSASDAVVVPAKVDLSIVKELQGELQVGRPGTYTLSVHNDGPSADPGVVTVVDQLPPGLSYVSGIGDGWICGEDAGLVTCDREGDFESGATEVIVLSVLVEAAAFPTVSNTATVASPAADTDPLNNTDTVTSDVAGLAVLGLDKSLQSHKDAHALWRLTVSNDGPTRTTAPIVVTDELPAGLKYVSAEGSGWDCIVDGRTITCTFDGILDVGAEASFTVDTTVTVKDGRTIVNEAIIVGDDGAIASDDATVTAPDPTGGLPDTGGSAWWFLLAALVAMAGGGFAVNRRRSASAVLR